MKKSEIKQGIKSIKEAIIIVRESIDEKLQPYEYVKEHLEAIEEIQNESGIDCGIDFETVLCDALRSCIYDNPDVEEINSQFEILLDDLESWLDEVGERKQEQIQEQYIDILNEIKDNFDVDSIECQEDLDNQLFDMLNALDDMEI